jgi:polyphosphate kinase
LLNKSLNIIVQLEMKTGGKPAASGRCAGRAFCRRWSSCPATGRGGITFFSARSSAIFWGICFPARKSWDTGTSASRATASFTWTSRTAGNLLKAVENELHNRRKGDAVRLEIDHDCPETIRNALLGTLRLTEEDVNLIDGPLYPARLMGLYDGDHSAELRDPPFAAPVARALRRKPIFSPPFAARDILLHHPYESLTPWSIFWSNRPATRRCWPSSKRSIARAATRALSAR